MRRQVVGGQWSVVRSLRELLHNFLKLLTDYRSVEAIDGDACHSEAFAQSGEHGAHACLAPKAQRSSSSPPQDGFAVVDSGPWPESQLRSQQISTSRARRETRNDGFPAVIIDFRRLPKPSLLEHRDQPSSLTLVPVPGLAQISLSPRPDDEAPFHASITALGET